MTITTKFSIGDTVFFLFENQVVTSTVAAINYFTNKIDDKYSSETYKVAARGEFKKDDFYFYKNQLHATKADLLASL